MARLMVPRRVIVTAPSGRTAPVEAREAEPEGGESGAVWPTILMGILLVLGIVFPPILLLNLPILWARSAISEAGVALQESVSMPPFACPDCGVENPASEHGALPFDVVCGGCGARLSVTRAPRRNLAEPQPDERTSPAVPGDDKRAV